MPLKTTLGLLTKKQRRHIRTAMIRRAVRFSSGRRPKRQLESDVRTSIMDYLDRRKDCYAFIAKNTAPYTGGRFVRPPKGFKRGVSDIICQRLYPASWGQEVGRTYYIEVKRPARKKTNALPRRPEGKQSFWQKSFQREIELCGGIYIIARTLEDVKELFE